MGDYYIVVRHVTRCELRKDKQQIVGRLKVEELEDQNVARTFTDKLEEALFKIEGEQP